MTTGSAASRFPRFLGSLVPAVVLFVLFAAVVVLVMRGIPGLTGVLVGAAAGGCLVLALLLVYWNLVDWINLRVIRRFVRAGHADWHDGAVVAVEGVVRVEGEPLISPFTRTPCAAYTYVLSTHRHSSVGNRSVRVVIAQGFHLVRSTIDGAGRRLRLCAFPGVDTELRRTESGTTWGDEARALVQSLTGHAPAAGEGEILSRLLEARQVDTEEIRQDYCMGTVGPHADGITIEEDVLPVGRMVCVIGTYDRSRNGLTARRRRIGPNLMVYPGSAGEVVARLRNDLAWFTRAAVVLVAVSAAAMAYAMVPRSEGEPAMEAPAAEAPSDATVTEPLDPDAAYLEQVDAGARREFAAGNVARALELAIDADAAATVRWLLAEGVSPETPIAVRDGTHMIALVEASRLGHIDTVEALLEGGANPNSTEPTAAGGTPPPTALEWALERGHCDVAARLEQAGARRPPGSPADACRQGP